MKKSSLLPILASLIFILFAPIASYAHVPVSINGAKMPSLAPMLSHVTPAVVNITVEKIEKPTKKHRNARKVIGVGSGVIINAKKGYIVTNAHVISNEKVMTVTLKDGRHFHAKLIGKDDGFDIAVIQIHAKHLKQITFGNSSKLKVGDFVVAIGSPFNLSQTVTSGVISALNRDQPHVEGFQNFIQTDAPINPGNSGGALIDMQGKLIGINTAIVTPSSGNIGIGFAIPSNLAKNAAHQLIQYGKVKRGMLGVFAQNITPTLASALGLKSIHGAIVTQVIPNSPANKAGIQPKDIITAINGNPIRSSEQLHNTLGLMRPRTKLKVTLLRNHRKRIFSVAVADPKSILLEQALPFLSGMQMQQFSDLESDGIILTGVLVTHVDDNSEGAIAGLIPGDVIIKANDKPVKDIPQLITAAKHAKNKLLLTVARGQGKLFLVLQREQ